MAPHLSIVERKQALRQSSVAVRTDCDPALGHRLIPLLLASPLMPAPGAIVAGFWPLPGEIDVRPLLHALAENGCLLCLPETPPRGSPLLFRQWTPGEALQLGRFGTRHSTGPVVTPETLLVPLLAFDRSGARLGFGGGYYDRTLPTLPHSRAIGCAFAAQEVPAVPTEPFDVPLDAVVTEQAFHLIRA